VAVLTEADVRALAAFKGTEAPVTSVYLDVDGAHHVRRKDLLHELDALLKPVRRDHREPSVLQDLKKIEDLVRGGIDRSNVRGLAVFSCSAHGLWRVLELPVTVRSQIVVNHTPAVRQLETVLDEYEAFGVLVADKHKARMFVYELGELVDSSDLLVEDHGHDHLKHAADVAFTMLKDDGFERLIIGAPEEIANELESLLHPYLRERVVARCHLRIDASLDEIRQTALEVEADVERRKEAAAVARLRDAVGSHTRGVAGIDETLKAIVERRVDVLLVSSGYTAPGWRCNGCGWIGRRGRTCSVCSAAMHEVEDLVEEAIEEALAQSCEVEVCVGNADLDVLGQIGAILRY
jgi:peptide chain release factor subunit 1